MSTNKVIRKIETSNQRKDYYTAYVVRTWRPLPDTRLHTSAHNYNNVTLSSWNRLQAALAACAVQTKATYQTYPVQDYNYQTR